MKAISFFGDGIEEATACGPDGVTTTSTFLPLHVSHTWRPGSSGPEAAYLVLACKIAAAVLENPMNAAALLEGCPQELATRTGRVLLNWKSCDIHDLTRMATAECRWVSFLGLYVLKKRGIMFSEEIYQSRTIAHDSMLRRLLWADVQ